MAQNLEVGMRCVKYMLFISNIMFVMVGILLLSFGTTIKSIYTDFSLFMEDNYFSPAKLTIAIGIIIFMISAFGCAAAIKESTCMVNVYALLLGIVFILEISASIAAYTMRNSVSDYVAIQMRYALYNYERDPHAKHSMDYLQEELSCCGINSKFDWNKYYPNWNGSYPQSCYIYGSTPEQPHVKIPSLYGCLDRLIYIISESAFMLGTGALCISFVQILGIVFAILLAKSIRRLKTERAAQRWQLRQELYLKLARGSEKPTVPETPVTYVSTNAENGSTDA